MSGSSGSSPGSREASGLRIAVISACILGGLGAAGAIAAAAIGHSPPPGPTTINSADSQSPSLGPTSVNTPSSAASSEPLLAATGTISQPTSGFNVARKTFLHASGTAEGIPSSSRLWLFIQWKGVQTFWASDPRDMTFQNGRWSDRIYVGSPGQLTLWLVDLGPKALKVLNTDVYGQNNGFSTIHLAADAKVLASLPFTST
jgi:hypothetical protein